MNVSRRTVLGLGASVPLAAVAPSTFAAPATSGPSPADWTDLDRSIDGHVVLPGSSAYASRHKLFDPHWDFRRPAAIARVQNPSDMATCVTFARDHRLEVVGRSGGHSYTGASARSDALVVDTRGLHSTITGPDHRRATIGAGADLYSVHEELARYDRSVPTGTCPTVGSAGLSIVGGVGVDSRRHGLMCDRLVRATVVDGRGRVLRVDEDSEQDLFWSLRGGGPGGVLVATATYRTIPAWPMGFFDATFPASSAASVVRDWADWIAGQPRNTWSNAHVDVSGSSLSVRVFGVTPAGKEEARLSSLRSAVRARPTRTSTTTRDFMGGVEYLGGGSTSPRTRFVAGSDVLRRITAGGGEAIEEAMRQAASRGLSAAAILDPWDGAVADLGAGDTPCPWRHHAASVQWYVGTNSSTSRHAARGWLLDAHELIGARSSGGYLGYVESGTRLSRYLGENAAKVSRTRHGYDPHDVIA